jgi:hypothetical protein
MEKRHEHFFIEEVSGRRTTDPHAPINAKLLKFTDGSSAVVVGLTKREYFAAMAMQAIVTRTIDGEFDSDTIAEQSIDHAEALIDALNNYHK